MSAAAEGLLAPDKLVQGGQHEQAAAEHHGAQKATRKGDAADFQTGRHQHVGRRPKKLGAKAQAHVRPSKPEHHTPGNPQKAQSRRQPIRHAARPYVDDGHNGQQTQHQGVSNQCYDGNVGH